ncbi:HEAT repeat domain-containing protein [Paraburkholderia sediminicola]|uniref:hypothetical protein n=1 Tax=Paraburkholderia sediminicola TaxID=458836 RepID=UPI0038BB3978
MAESRKLVKVFLASPGDVVEERRLAKTVADEVNQLLGDEFSCQIELVGWEDTVSVFGRPQATINRELERCELLIGVVWKHWGTPPDTEGHYTSGFEEEFRTSVERRLKENRPEISLFFKQIDSDLLRDPGPSLQKVLEFKREITSGKQILYEAFADSREFETRLRRCLVSYIKKLRDNDRDQNASQTTAPADTSIPSVEAEVLPLSTSFSKEGSLFLRKFLDDSPSSGTDQYTAADVARFRLLAGLIEKHGNDECVLGVHDCNVLYFSAHKTEFGSRELHGLVKSNLHHYENENSPIWKWFIAIDGFQRQLLPFYSVSGTSSEVHVAALRAMCLVKEKLPTDKTLTRDVFLSSWLGAESNRSVKTAALNYLGDNGLDEDLVAIKAEFDRNDYQTRSAASEAMIRIRLRDSRQKAISTLFELQPTVVSRGLLAALFEKTDALPDSTLLEGISHQNPDVRVMSAQVASQRKILTVDIAQALVGDVDARVRLIALEFLVENGQRYSNREIEQILVKKNHGNALLGLSDPTSAACLDTFKWRRLNSLTDAVLEDTMVASLSLFEREAYFVLTERRFRARAAALRAAVDDRFEAYYTERIRKMASEVGPDSETIERMPPLKPFIIKSLMQLGLDLLCRKSETCDLARIRRWAKTEMDSFSIDFINYIRKHGEWEDIPLIIRCAGLNVNDSFNSLDFTSGFLNKNISCATTLLALARGRVSDLIATQMPQNLLAAVITNISDKAFRGFSDETLMTLLDSDNTDVRRAVALKCVRAHPKARLKKILERYAKPGKQRFYNVVHWLDFGISLSRDRVLQAVSSMPDR